MMKADCPFLERLPRPQAESTYGCGVSINFYPVGKDRDRCRVCSIALLDRLPTCRHLYACSWLESHPDGTPFVKVELLCGLTDDVLPDLSCCARCPERLAQAADVSQPVVASTMAV